MCHHASRDDPGFLGPAHPGCKCGRGHRVHILDSRALKEQWLTSSANKSEPTLYLFLEVQYPPSSFAQTFWCIGREAWSLAQPVTKPTLPPTTTLKYVLNYEAAKKYWATAKFPTTTTVPPPVVRTVQAGKLGLCLKCLKPSYGDDCRVACFGCGLVVQLKAAPRRQQTTSQLNDRRL
ncbi:hypothetical protein Y032_0042g525 [Ancylostoma ceylanicum]|nr:hypothetical protein Y032_0042g525 [Ancylostoma ceylanicum]